MPQSPATWRDRNCQGYCSASSNARSAAGVATHWPILKSGCFTAIMSPFLSVVTVASTQNPGVFHCTDQQLQRLLLFRLIHVLLVWKRRQAHFLPSDVDLLRSHDLRHLFERQVLQDEVPVVFTRLEKLSDEA